MSEDRIFVKWNSNFRDEFAGRWREPEIKANEDADGCLGEQFYPRGRAAAALLDDLGIVVVESQSSQDQNREEREQDQFVVGPSTKSL